MRTETDESTELRRRLAQVVSEHGQAAVSRATHTPQSSISRYLKDRRIPADFLARLARAFEINADWLLHGRGATYATDVSNEPTGVHRTVIELARAVDAVARTPAVRLASEQREEIWRLGRALDRVEALEEKLEDEAGAVFLKVRDKYAEAFHYQDIERAEALLEAMRELSRLIRSPDVMRRYRESAAILAEHRGDLDAALDALFGIFRESLVLPEPQWRVYAVNYVRLLFKTFRLERALRVAHASLALHDESEDSRAHGELRVAAGMCELELGRIRRGRELLAHGFPSLRPRERSLWRVNYLVALSLEGTLAMEEAIDLTDRETADHPFARKAAARTLALHVLANEASEPVDRMLERFGADLGERDQELGTRLHDQVRWIADAIRSDGRVDGEFPVVRSDSAPLPVRFEAAALSAQAYRWTGDPRLSNALEDWEEAKRAGPDRQPFLSLRMIHARQLEATAGPEPVEPFWRALREGGLRD